MKRIFIVSAAFALLAGPVHAAGGFSCESGENDKTRVVIEGATPRSDPGLINFGAVVERDGNKIEFQKSDVKAFTGKNGIIQLRAVVSRGEQQYTLRMNVKRNLKDEDDWAGTYELASAPVAAKDKDKDKAKAKTKVAPVRGKVTCSVE